MNSDSFVTRFGGICTIGAGLHGGYDLANLANPPASLAADLPNAAPVPA